MISDKIKTVLADALRRLALAVFVLPQLQMHFREERYRFFSFIDLLLISDTLLITTLRSSTAFHTPSFTSLT